MALTLRHELFTFYLPGSSAPVSQQFYLKVSKFKGINPGDF
jgi:hypothetical protein